MQVDPFNDDDDPQILGMVMRGAVVDSTNLMNAVALLGGEAVGRILERVGEGDVEFSVEIRINAVPVWRR